MTAIITVKLIFLALFTFAIIQKFMSDIHNWFDKHQGVLTVLSTSTIVTFTISFIDIIVHI